MKMERTCIACRKKFNQDNLYRLVLNNGEVVLQQGKKIEGRGAYICKNNNCIEKAIKLKSLNRIFKKNIDADQYDKIINSLKD